jgi:hypothetical protein
MPLLLHYYYWYITTSHWLADTLRHYAMLLTLATLAISYAWLLITLIAIDIAIIHYIITLLFIIIYWYFLAFSFPSAIDIRHADDAIIDYCHYWHYYWYFIIDYAITPLATWLPASCHASYYFDFGWGWYAIISITPLFRHCRLPFIFGHRLPPPVSLHFRLPILALK